MSPCVLSGNTIGDTALGCAADSSCNNDLISYATSAYSSY